MVGWPRTASHRQPRSIPGRHVRGPFPATDRGLGADLTPVDQQLLADMDVERVAENLFGGERGYRLFFART